MRKKIFYLFILFIPILMFFLTSQNTFAANLSTSSLDLHYAPDGFNSYRWQNGMLYGSNSGGTQGVNYVNLSTGSGYANLYQFSTPSINATGNYMTLNFETNIVITANTPTYRGKFVNLPYMSVQYCSGSGAFSNMQVIDKSLSTAVTEWNDGKSLTLTVYGSIAYRNVGQGSSGSLTCQIGNPDYSFLTTDNTFSTTYVNRVFFEKNPGSIEFSNNINDALLQMQVNQNNTIINQNQQMIEQDQQDRDDVQSASDSGQDNADASQQQNEQATSSLLSVIGSFIQALGAPASNCQVRTDLGNIDLGTLDFCAGKPAELTPIINTVCAMVMCIPIYLIAKDLFKRFVYITTFAQGGEYK